MKSNVEALVGRRRKQTILAQRCIKIYPLPLLMKCIPGEQDSHADI